MVSDSMIAICEVFVDCGAMKLSQLGVLVDLISMKDDRGSLG